MTSGCICSVPSQVRTGSRFTVPVVSLAEGDRYLEVATFLARIV
jgi:hypothetical protein